MLILSLFGHMLIDTTVHSGDSRQLRARHDDLILSMHSETLTILIKFPVT